jgi:hypothetical protein
MIYMATPIWRYLDAMTAQSIAAAIAFAPPREEVAWETLVGDALISRTRSQLATKFLHDESVKDADVMVIIDDDVQFQPEDLWRIVDGAREHNCLYGGVYFTRERVPHSASLGLNETPMRFQAYDDDGNRLPPNPVEIRYLATGFMAIPRTVLAAMLVTEYEEKQGYHTIEYCERGGGDLPFYDFFRTFVIEDEDIADRSRKVAHYLSEDWAFGERARQAGYRTLADQSIMLGHRGVVTLTAFDAAQPGHALTEAGEPSKQRGLLMSRPEKALREGPVMGSVHA